MCFDHRNWLGMLQSVNNKVLCPFYTRESHAKWPCVSVWDRESGRCLLCTASDAITANLLTGLLCQELPEETAPLHMNLSGGQLEGSRFLTVCICANWVCCYTLWGKIMLRVMMFLLVPARLFVCTTGLWLLYMMLELQLTWIIDESVVSELIIVFVFFAFIVWQTNPNSNVSDVDK